MNGMVRIGTVVMNVGDLARAATFWRAALGYVPRHPGSTILEPADGATGQAMNLDENDRTHLDLYVDSAAEQEAEVERLLSMGATRVPWTYPDDADFVVLADTEGNVFCVVNTAH
jgi:catechol 2,3-dioxygenase-like lactoylglutathione lyase family enzyme